MASSIGVSLSNSSSNYRVLLLVSANPDLKVLYGLRYENGLSLSNFFLCIRCMKTLQRFRWVATRDIALSLEYRVTS